MSDQQVLPLLTIGEVADRLHVSRATVRRRINDRSLQAVRVGHRSGASIRVPADAVDALLRPATDGLTSRCLGQAAAMALASWQSGSGNAPARDDGSRRRSALDERLERLGIHTGSCSEAACSTCRSDRLQASDERRPER